MKDVIIDTLFDALKLIPFLFFAFLIIEFIEHKLNKKAKKVIAKSGRFGPFFGSLLGLVPQCGFSLMATNLYVTRIISLGTLIAVYLSTSDEMLPLLLSNNVEPGKIISLLITKFLTGLLFGFIIDFFLRKKKKEKEDYHICSYEECHCDNGIFLSSLKHTLKTLIFIFIATFLLNTIIYYVKEENISKIFLKNSIFGPFISSLIGLIPNCAASIIITELYIKGAITFGTTVAGLLTGSGVALLVLFKSNRNIKENFQILALVYFIGSITGVIFEIFNTII